MKRVKPNHTTDENLVIEGPADHSLDLDRVIRVLADSIALMGVVHVTFHLIHQGKHRTHSDIIHAGDAYAPTLALMWKSATVYKVTIRHTGRGSKTNPKSIRKAPKVGDRVTVRGLKCRIIEVRPMGAIDVMSDDNKHAFRLSGLPLDNPRNPRRPTRMGVVLGNAIRGNPVLQTGVRESADDLDDVTGQAANLSHL